MSPLPKRGKLRKCPPLGGREGELYASLPKNIFLKKSFVFFQENSSDGQYLMELAYHRLTACSFSSTDLFLRVF